MELQKIALIGLLTMFFYFLMVQLWDKPKITNPNNVQITTHDQPITNRLPETFNTKFESKCPSNLAQSSSPFSTLGKPPSWDERNELAETPLQGVGKSDSLPKEVNSDLFEKTADFASDVTNINQFYKNNPDVLKRVSNADWDFPKMPEPTPNAEILGYNFERNFTALI